MLCEVFSKTVETPDTNSERHNIGPAVFFSALKKAQKTTDSEWKVINSYLQLRKLLQTSAANKQILSDSEKGIVV